MFLALFVSQGCCAYRYLLVRTFSQRFRIDSVHKIRPQPGRTRYGPTHLLCPKAGGQIGCVCPENQIPEHAGGTPLDLVWNTRGVHFFGLHGTQWCKKSGSLRKMEQGLVTVCFDFEMDLAQSHQISVKQVWNRSPEVTRVPVEMDLCYSKTRFQETCQKNQQIVFLCVFPGFPMNTSTFSSSEIRWMVSRNAWTLQVGRSLGVGLTGHWGFSVTQQDLLAIARLWRYSRHLQRFDLCSFQVPDFSRFFQLQTPPKNGWWKMVKHQASPCSTNPSIESRRAQQWLQVIFNGYFNLTNKNGGIMDN